MTRNAFTLIELLVVIAIIAILAAILFPVFSQAKEAAKLSASLSQMKQLALSSEMYSSDYDDELNPASMRTLNPSDTPTIWTERIQPYVKSKQIMSAVGSSAGYAENWATRRVQSIGLSDATGYDPLSTQVAGAAAPGTEGFTTTLNASVIEESLLVALYAVTPNGPAGDTTTKHRGYVFNPYNGLVVPGAKSYRHPMVSDKNLVTVNDDVNFPNSSILSPGQLKPIYARYGGSSNGSGRTPIVFADSHAKVYSAAQLVRSTTLQFTPR